MHQFARILAAATALILLVPPAQARWTTYRNDSGTTVPFPDIFAFTNERNESPAQFIKRVIVDDRRKLTYQRVARDFFVFSAPENDRILYRRCNFARDRMIHCVDLRYPRAEKRAFDGIVTRMSLALRPR